MNKFFQKILSFSIIGLILFAISGIAFTDNVSAFTGRGTSGQEACPTFLGLTSWDCGVVIEDENSLKAGIWTIVANIATDITVIAAYLVLGYVIYGGYQYIFSSGDPSKVAAGKKTIVRAFIGLAIVMSANVIMGAIRIALVGGSGNIGNCFSDSGCVDTTQMVTNLINWVVGFVGVVAVVFLIYGGIGYMTSSGDPGKVKKAKDTIMYALIGIIIVAIAEVITGFVSNLIRTANPTSHINTTTQEIIISKENIHD